MLLCVVRLRSGSAKAVAFPRRRIATPRKIPLNVNGKATTVNVDDAQLKLDLTARREGKPAGRQRERRAVGLPVERRRPAVGIAHIPAPGQPPLRPCITAVGDKVRILADGNRPRRDRAGGGETILTVAAGLSQKIRVRDGKHVDFTTRWSSR